VEQGASRSGEIVAELRHRIETGELAPGDRVPSTREIVRRWGVAMATATKVLTQLRHEGLVRAVPGVGTVVATGAGPAPRPTARPARARPRPVRGDEEVSSARIVAAAIAVADAEGLASVSMRRVAAELGMATMSMYRYVADKEDLLARMDEQEPALRKLLAAGRFPKFARLNAEGYDFDLDGLFEFGLQRLLDGIAVFVGEPPR
jgi:DNA-binding transcriptional MocR family regulator